MMDDHCGTCRHGKMIAQDLSKRVCKGAPPVPVLLQGTVRYLWPVVMANDEACGCYGVRAAALPGVADGVTVIKPDGTHIGPAPLTKGRPELLND